MNYSIEGLGLKLNTREDIAPYLGQIEPNITQLEEIHLCGNTIGVGAAQALAEVLHKASEIRVRPASVSYFDSIVRRFTKRARRWQILPTSSPGVSSRRSRRPSLPSATP